MRFSGLFGIIAGAEMLATSVAAYRVALSAMHEIIATVLLAGGVTAIAIGILTLVLAAMREDMRIREVRRMVAAGEGGEIWKER